MKIVKLIACAFILCSLTSCFEIRETYDIYADGSYKVSYTFDVSKGVTEMSKMVSESGGQKEELMQKTDTTIYFKSMPDSIWTKLNGAERAVYDQTSLNIHCHPTEKLFNISIDNQGKSLKELNGFLNGFDAMMSHIDNLMKNPAGVPPPPNTNLNPMKIDHTNFSYEVSAGRLERRISEKQKEEADEQSALKMLEGMNLTVPYKLVINLPHATRNLHPARGTYSTDGKTYTMELNWMDAIKDPELLSFKIIY